jgi:hypothetical protein
LARDAQSFTSEGHVSDERKIEGAPDLVLGRIEELRRLEAGERALADALGDYARAAKGGGQLLHLADRHRQIAAQLAVRIVALGGQPAVDPDDQWILGPTHELRTIRYAEESALRTYHDHLADFDPETMALVRDRILVEHEDTLALLTGGDEGVSQPFASNVWEQS